jgi:diacylglycerol kinase (ATP)
MSTNRMRLPRDNQQVSTSVRHIVVAVNPTAAFGKNASAGDQTVSALESAGFTVTALRAESFELLTGKLTLALRGTPDAVVVVGGDGMVSLAVNAIATSSIPLGIVPAGTGNDLARGLGLIVGDVPASIQALIEALGREPQRIDLGHITSIDQSKDRWFAGILSAGFDAIVNERANAMRWPKGKSRYTWALLRELVALTPRQYTLTANGRTWSERAVLVSIANNTHMGGGMKVAPDASLTDGLLDIFVLRPLSRLRFLRLFPRVFAGTHVVEPEVVIEQATEVVLESEGIVAYADGERVWELPLRVSVVPAAARIFV